MSRLRADSGFANSAFLEHLEERQHHYIIALRQNQPLQRALVDTQGWWSLLVDKGERVGERCRFIGRTLLAHVSRPS